jgi:hypothetical protein
MRIVTRRDVIAGTGLLAGVGSMAGAGVAAEAAAGDQEAVMREIRDEIRSLRAELTSPPSQVARVRAEQHRFLRASARYPEFLEVGVGVFDGVHDWLRHQPHPVEVARLSDGRYGLRFDFTTLVLRSDTEPDFVGTAGDGR